MLNLKQSILLSLAISLGTSGLNNSALAHGVPASASFTGNKVLGAANLSGTTKTHSASTASPPAVNLNLGSSSKLAIQSPISTTINTTTGTKTGTISVNKGELLTAAEYAAVMQIVSGSGQTLTLDSSGKAIGGTLSLSSISTLKLDELVVPKNVTLLGAQSGNTLTLTGELINSGTIITSLQSSGNTFQINATQVQNNAGAVITSIIPNSPAPTSINLTIDSAGSIVNQGSITAGGTLAISNSGSFANGLSGKASSALIAGNLGTQLSTTGNIITNSGAISSQQGNVSITKNSSGNLTVLNSDGSITASLGTVTFTNNASSSTAHAISLSGGSVSGSLVTFNGGKGAVSVAVDQISGPIDVQSSSTRLDRC